MVSTAHLTDPTTPPPRVSRDCDRAVVWLDGEHDIATVPVLANVLALVVADDDGDVMVDLSGATFFDAATAVCGRSGLVEPLSDEDESSASCIPSRVDCAVTARISS